MKLIIQIPCLNEEATLQRTIAELPSAIPGIDCIELLVIDDGSNDATTEVAVACGVHHVIRNKQTQGLAWAFRKGLRVALDAGADIIVNTDADNQYCGADVVALVEPILRGKADIVIGDRVTATVPHFSPLKRLLQRLGSAVVRRLAGADVADAVCGFRAISREAALQLNIVSKFSYTTEMVIQAGRRRMAVVSVPVRTNEVTRESRLFQNVPQFIARTLSTMIRTYAMYQPLRAFFYIGTALFLVGIVPMLRFLYFFATGDGGGHIQSLVIGGSFMVMGFVTYMIGLLADLIAVNRQLLEDMLQHIRQREMRGDGNSDTDGG
jgi:glycosyltransferase involved in cell wall biosynthesis